MGSVHKETESQGRGIHQFDNISYTDENTLRQLILHCREIDLYYENRLDQGYDRDSFSNIPYAADISPFYEMIIIMYIDLENLIARAKLTENQRVLIDKLMYGYTLEDFADVYHKDLDAVNLTFDKAIYNLSQQAEEDWKLGLQWDTVRTKTEWKKCSKCEEWWPKTEEYYRVRIDNKGDGFYSYCRKCESDEKM